MVRHTKADDDESTETTEGDTVFIRTDDGVIRATVDEAEYDFERPEDGARMGGTLDTDDPSVHYVDDYHDEPDDEPYAEDLAAEFADDLSRVNFDAVVSAVENEYAEAGHDPTTDSVLTPVGLAVRLCGDALAEADDTVVTDAASMIDFDGSDEVTVEYDGFEHDDPHATPIALPLLAGLADAATDRTVRFRDGAGSIRVYVEVPERRDDEDDTDE